MRPFYLCNDPEVIMPTITGCIYSYKKPRFFAIVERIRQDTPVSKISYKGANVIFSYGLNGEPTQDYLLAVNDNIDNTPYPKLNKVLVKAAEWFVKVQGLEAKAKRVDYGFLHDYTPVVPDLQLVRYEHSAEFLLSFGHGVQGFKTLPEAEEFMIKLLKVPENVVKGDRVINAG